MDDKIKRTRSVQVRLSPEEYDLLEHKFKLSGYKSKSEFMRTVLFETLIFTINHNEWQEFLRHVRNITANVNQIAKRVNSTGNIYYEDMEEIKKGIEEIWQHLKYFRSQVQQVWR